MTSEARIEQWFPKNIYIVNELLVGDLPKYKKWIDELFEINGELKRTQELNVNSTHELTSIHNQDMFNDLTTEFIKYVNDFAQKLGFQRKLEMANMWTNKVKRGEYLFPHVHPESVISGAYYVESDNSQDVIKFYDSPHSMYSVPENTTNLNFTDCQYECTPGRLILFQSNFPHGCPALVGDSKIVISFNTSFITAGSGNFSWA